jgi:polynucleotide 5'-kinase involved in rRNA processing
MQLIRISSDLKSYEVNQEALNVIRSIEGDLGVVAVSGAQRTGKSFILNLLLEKHGV